MLRKSLAAFVACLLPLQAQAQIFGWSGGPVEYKPEPYAADASKTPPQMALACYALFLVIEEHKGEIFIAEDQHKALKMAYLKQVEAAIAQSGQRTDPPTMVRPYVDQLRQRWDALDAMNQRDVCTVAADAGMVALRADPGGLEALTCWSVAVNARPDEPQVAFLQTDLAIAMVTFKVPYSVRDDGFDLSKSDAAQALAGPQAEAVKQKYAGCEARVRPALRKAIWSTERWGVDKDYSPLEYIQKDLAAGLGGQPVSKLAYETWWTLSPAAWAKFIDSPAAGDAAICVDRYFFRDANKPKGGWTRMDLGVKVLTDLGMTTDEAYVVLASAGWKIRQDVNQFSIDPDKACAVWEKATAAKFGGTVYTAKRPY